MRSAAIAGLCLLLMIGCAGESTGPGAPLSSEDDGLGQLSGKVEGTVEGLLPVVYAYNTDKDLAYTVFVVDGEYRAVKMIPGRYDVTIRRAVDQLEGFDSQTVSIEIGPGDAVELDFSLTGVGPVVDYAGGMNYPNAEILPYDEVYPPGPGRDILERACHGCHTIQLFSYNDASRAYPGSRGPKTREAWEVVVDRMYEAPAFGRAGKASLFDPKFLPPEDRDILVDYLAETFPADRPAGGGPAHARARAGLRSAQESDVRRVHLPRVRRIRNLALAAPGGLRPRRQRLDRLHRVLHRQVRPAHRRADGLRRARRRPRHRRGPDRRHGMVFGRRRAPPRPRDRQGGPLGGP